MNNEKYKNWLLVNGIVPSTVKNYTGRIKLLLGKFKVEELNENTISQYLLESAQKLSPSTINGYKYAIKSFLKFLNKEISFPRDLKIISKLPDTITKEYFEKEVIPLVECIFQNSLKVKAILYLMFYTGLRIGEVALLERKNIDLIEGGIKLYVKKTKEERLGLIVKKRARDIIASYFLIEPEETNAFNTTKFCIEKTIQKIDGFLEDVHFYPHLLRHSFATFLLKEGVDISVVSALLGHKNINTTKRYLRLDIDTIKQIIKKRIK